MLSPLRRVAISAHSRSHRAVSRGSSGSAWADVLAECPSAQGARGLANGAQGIVESSPLNRALFSMRAAYTAVDRAETEPEAVYAANAVGAETIARAAAPQQVPVIQISTDYVFDGTKRGAYVETDPIALLGVYGQTKATGEAMSWVYRLYAASYIRR